MMKTKIFISRKLTNQSPFLKELKDYNLDIEGQMLINFTPITFQQPKSDWLFFYSKTGINHFLKGGGRIDRLCIGTFGTSTAKYFEEETGITPHFIGKGIKEKVHKNFSHKLGTGICLFVHGKNSLKSVQKLRNNHSDLSLVVYDNNPKTEITIDSPDIAVFTSPMAVRVYFNKYPNRKHINIAIGMTTLEALENEGIHHNILSKYPSEEHLAHTVKTYLRNI